MRFAGGMIGSEAGQEMDLYEITSAISRQKSGARADTLQTLAYGQTQPLLLISKNEIALGSAAAETDRAYFES